MGLGGGAIAPLAPPHQLTTSCGSTATPVGPLDTSCITGSLYNKGGCDARDHVSYPVTSEAHQGPFSSTYAFLAPVMTEKRHAFLLLVHDNPVQVHRLVGALKHPAFDLFIHVDKKANFADFASLPVRTIESVYDIRWGGFRMVEATLHLLRTAVTERYDTYTLLSGSDYPLRSNEQIRRVLDGTNKSRIDYWHDEDLSWHSRYQRLFFNDYGPIGRMLNAVSRRLWRVLPPLPFLPGIVPYFGSQWWTLTREGVEAVLSFVQRNPSFVARMRWVHIPDEMFFQTVLVQTGVPLMREPLRFMDWSERKAHPAIVSHENIDQAFASGCLFARKVDDRAIPGVSAELERLRHEREMEYRQDPALQD